MVLPGICLPINIKKRAIIILALFFISGCAGRIDNSAAKDEIISNHHKGHYIKDVPFIPQEELYCGPASLAMVLNFYGFKITQEEIAKEIYMPKLKGTLNIDLLTFAKQKGFAAKYYIGNLDDLKANISRNMPVILFVDLGYDFYPVRHYMAAIGFDHEKGIIIAHSGKERDKIFSNKELLKVWEKTSFGTLLITPPEIGM
ncbi:MAG TPA: peptidase C39 [Deltaproteobacteria bacterium]|nr:peptidase C39 [Deltaproteobacteria bacterium]